MLVRCPECDAEVSDSAVVCPKCGYPLERAPSQAQGLEHRPIAQKPATPACLIIACIGLFLCLSTPRFLLFLPLLITAGFAVFSIVRKERWRWAAALVLVGCLGVLALSASPSSSSLAGQDVTYSVSGSATSASLTYENGDGGTSQEKVPLPWSTTVKAPSSGYLYVSAQNEGEFGEITCRISVNGNVIKTSNSSGSYSIATCSGP